jgi:CubicO group peptidase (beta-lactamase class C family)
MSMTATELQQLVEELVHESGVPGAGAVLATDNGVIGAFAGVEHIGNETRISERSRFEVSCLMKFYMSLIAIKFICEGRLDAEAAIEEFVPELESQDAQRPIRVRHLLSHTSGLRGVDISAAKARWGLRWPEFIAALNHSPPSFVPGVVFSYEHSEHVILGAILERIKGRPAFEAVRDELLAEAGVTLDEGRERGNDHRVGQHRLDLATRKYTGVVAPPFGQFWRDSLPDLTMTLTDHVMVARRLLKWSTDVQRGQSGATSSAHSLISTPAIRLPSCISSGSHEEVFPKAFSLGCGIYESGVYGHNGSMPGQTCAVRLDWDRRSALAVGLNAWVPHARDRLIDAILSRIASRRTRTTGLGRRTRLFDWRSLSGGFSVPELCGHYVGGYLSRVEVSARKGGLRMSFGANPALRTVVDIRHHAGGYFAVEGRGPTSIGFFANPTSGEPVLMGGAHAYRKLYG